MIGAMIGDIAGSRFEWDNIKTKNFTLLADGCFPTDDSLMTLALAKAILESGDERSDLEKNAVKWMQRIGRKYPDGGYGGNFYYWLLSRNPKPYNSFGNGAAMRVSPCAWAAKSEEEAVLLSKTVTEVTHNHPEGIKAAEAVTVAIWMANHGETMESIRKRITEEYYPIDYTLADIRPDYEFDVTCMGSVPQAFQAFFESDSFEDAVRNAISIGGDSDTIAAITGSIAEAFYGVPEEIRRKALTFLSPDLRLILEDFEMKYPPRILK